MSRRFLDSFHAATPPFQMMVQREVVHLLTMRASVRDWVGRYEQVKYPGRRVLEVDLGGGPRLLADVGHAGAITLLNFGPHNWFTSYTATMLARDVAERQPMADTFRPAGGGTRLRSVGAKDLRRYANETQPEWLYFLDEAQVRITDAIVTDIEDALAGDTKCMHFLLGGPGTGKTSVLLQLLMRLSNSVVDNRETWDVRLDIGDRLAAFIHDSTGWDLSHARRPVSADDPADVLLVDDPSDTNQIERQARLRNQGALGALVVGFDPLQLQDSLEDAQYSALVSRWRAKEHILSSCYRQKAEVGAAALRVADAVAESSPFLREERKLDYRASRKRLTGIGNTVEFVNPSGRVIVEEHAGLAEWSQYLRWVRTQPIWTHWAPLLVAVDDGLSLPTAWEVPLEGLRADRVLLRNTTLIKGLEYQHVALVLTASRYLAIRDGFTGSGRTVYNDFRLARIPFSRAKDSIATFVLEGPSHPASVLGKYAPSTRRA